MRVEFEQFGDIVARGMKCNMRAKLHPLYGDWDFWSRIIDDHKIEIKSLIRNHSTSRIYQLVVNLALKAMESIDVESVIDFIDSYTAELNEWRKKR